MTLVFLVAAILAAGLIPLPHRIEAAAILRPQDATQIFVSVGGTVVKSVAAGEVVARDQIVGRLDDAALESEVVQLESRVAELAAQIAVLESRRLADPALAAHIPATVQAAQAATLQLERRRKDLADLTLRSPRPGTILPPPIRTVTETDDDLSAWSGTPLDDWNLGCHLEPGTLYCLVGDPNRIEAVAIVEEGSIAFLKSGQRVRLQ
ncbi:MAG: hypothetical protein M3552_16780, partial [Planctomycetota bacterium]|nr:hypothetical protein [Planctomycetota bacterium]